MTIDSPRYHRLGDRSIARAKVRTTVGVPVHNALADVATCLSQIATYCSSDTHILIVDDGSDEPTAKWVENFASSDDRATLIRHDEAKGYTRAANVILKASDADCTVLLNSDTVVAEGWLDRLVAAAESAPDIGMVGPLSNAASWQSVPDVWADATASDFAVNELPPTWSVDDVAFAVAVTPSIVVPRVPLLNGFCTLIKRAVLDEVGYLDEVAFPHGYGEENDYAFRASDAGFALLLAMDAYVFHAKSRSFTHEVRRELSTAGSKAFRSKWPKRRIDDAIKTMRDHPVLEEKRQLMALATDRADTDVPLLRARSLPERVHQELAKIGIKVNDATVDVPPDDSSLRLSWSDTQGAELSLGATGLPVPLRTHDGVAVGSSDGSHLGGDAATQARRVAALVRLGSCPRLWPSAPRVARPVDGGAAKPPSRDPYLDRFDTDLATIEANERLVRDFRVNPSADLSRVTWFVPEFDHVLRGGLRTIFAVAQDLQRHYGTRNVFVLCGQGKRALDTVAGHVGEHFPDLTPEFHSLAYGDDPSTLPASDTAICTLWTTAYVLLRYNRCRAKFYFVQDWEPSFYEAGARSALIEQTYRFGYALLANSPGVAERCRKFDDLVGVFRPGVDTSMFHPLSDSVQQHVPRIVFYGRPRNARNGFDLGLEALTRVKRKLRDNVDIVSVGAEFDADEYGVSDVLRNMGVLSSLTEVAELYRRSTIGLVFMFTAHPSYQPLEYMASGCATVTNFNPSNAWLLRDGDNCKLAPSTPSGVAESVLQVLSDESLRATIVAGGLKTVEQLAWPDAFAAIRNFLSEPGQNRYVEEVP